MNEKELSTLLHLYSNLSKFFPQFSQLHTISTLQHLRFHSILLIPNKALPSYLHICITPTNNDIAYNIAQSDTCNIHNLKYNGVFTQIYPALLILPLFLPLWGTVNRRFLSGRISISLDRQEIHLEANSR